MVHISILTSPTLSQITELTDLLLASFEHHTSINACTGGLPHLKREFLNLTVRAGALEGVLLVAKENENENDDKFVSVAVCFRPGVPFMSTDGQQALGFDKYFSNLPSPVRIWWTETLGPQSKSLVTSTIGTQAELNAWVPVLIATHPEHQGKGYGRAITQYILQFAKEEGDAVVLSTSQNKAVGFYKSLGFKVEGDVDIPSEFGKFTSTLLTWKSEM